VKGVVAAAFAAALALGACGGDSDTASTTDTTAPEQGTGAGGGGEATGDTITIKNFKFMPDKLTANVGDMIKVTNEDNAAHTLTAKDRSVDTGTLDEGASATITLAKAGTIDYICNIHPYMTGTIEVE
jgi:plastocyanin